MAGHGQFISEAYQALREGEFATCLDLSQKILENDTENYWAAYLEAVAVGYLGQRDEFLIKVFELEKLEEDSAYSYYLRALAALWQSSPDLEKALWNWAQVAGQKEGWLARELIEKARKKKPVIEMAQTGHIADFIILPDFLQEIPFHAKQDAAVIQPEPVVETRNIEKGPEKKRADLWPARNQKLRPHKIIFILLSLAFLVATASIALWQVIKDGPVDSSNEIARNYHRLSINESAHVMPNKKESLYLYERRDNLIADFNKAKELLARQRINQARYLLNRILLSNADFKSKEKSKIFLNFIPVPGHQEFNDNLEPHEVVKESKFYTNCLVLWQGRVLSLKTVDKGQSAQLVVTSDDKEYLVEAFLKTGKSDSQVLDIDEFGKGPPAKAIIYGTFKSLIGAQRAIYVELIRIWK